MKKFIIYGVASCLLLSSCATAFHPVPATAYQKRKPGRGQPNRDIRVGFFIADIAFGGIPLIIDFATKQIYKPSPAVAARKKIK